MSVRLVACSALLVAWGAWAPARAAKPDPYRAARQVDRLLAEAVHGGETVSPPASDATFLRRAFLDIVGDIPTPEHVTAFLLDPAPDKRARVVRELLARPQYGQNWARYWRDVILYRRLEDRAILAGDAVVVGLTERLNAGAGWDDVARSFITATGDVQAHGETAIFMAQDGRTEESTAEVARIFLGIQIQCAQCHDHPWDSWKREQFHELAAFFPRVALRPVLTPTKRSFQVVGVDRPDRRGRGQGDNENRRGSAEHYMPDMEDPQAPGERMQPRFFLTSATLPLGTPDAERRGRLADWVTESPWFATALVNRVWAELVGEPFYEAVDDIGPDRTPTAPEAVAFLSKRFADSGHDLKWLIQTICATQAYQRAARPHGGSSDGAPMSAGHTPRLRGDQLYSALLTALDVDETERARLATGGAGAMGPAGRGGPRLAFNSAFGFDPSVDRETVTASIPQALAMMNTPQINAGVRANPRTLLGRLMEGGLDDDALTDELYLRCLSRLPTDPERGAVEAYRDGAPSRREAYEDLFWALVNSAEFAHRR